MSKLKRERWIDESEIDEKILQIKNSNKYYVSENGNIYKQNKRYPNLFLKKKKFISHGYAYTSIEIDGELKSRRIHREVAKAFIPNDSDEKNIVGHKNNIKDDNRVENLYWTDTSENTKKAFDDGLAHNDKSFKDSQSIIVAATNLDTGIMSIFGSIKECAAKTNTPVSTICHQIKNPPKTKIRNRIKYEKIDRYNKDDD